jgi:hypothetical protein
MLKSTYFEQVSLDEVFKIVEEQSRWESTISGGTQVTHDWKSLYEAAVLETDREAMPGRIKAAQDAIEERLSNLASDSLDQDEIVKAMAALGVLKNEWCGTKSSSENPPLGIRSHPNLDA